MIIIKRTRFIDEEIYIMNKVSKGLVLALAGITVGTSTGLSTTFFQSTSVAYAAEMTKEKNDLPIRGTIRLKLTLIMTFINCLKPVVHF